MKLLTIGLDGGDRRIIEQMPMPFLHSLLEQDKAPPLRGDLFSRGWAEIYTGRDALETGAMYIHPRLDGTYRFSLSFNYKRPLSRGIKPIWQTLNDHGCSVGMMNIPTSSPAHPVDGFFVGGAGGGINKVSGVPMAMCDTEETKTLLDERGYIPDLRIGPGGVPTIFDMFDRIDEIIEKRRDCFLELCRRHEPEFGFLCYRTITTVQYVTMSEIEAIIAARELDDANLGPGEYPGNLNKVQERILRHYRQLDKMLESVFDACKPDDFLFCADHGTSNYKFNANANAMLQEVGYLVPQMEAVRPVRQFIWKAWKKGRKFLPTAVKRIVRAPKAATRAHFLPIDFNPSKTRAFGNWYVHGIYLNDENRFGGPVRGRDMDRVVDELCEVINEHPDSKRYKIKAVPFRREHKDSHWYDELPDIELQKPDEMFFIGKGPYVSNNENFGPIPENIEGLKDMNSGQKSSVPLFAASEGVTKLIREDDPRNLCLVQKVIARYFGCPED